MNSDNQIEKMANDIAKICPDLVENCCGQINCVTHLTLSLSKIGYRKSSEVAREIFEEIDDLRKRYTVSFYGGHYYSMYMNEEYAELKKKYTEDEK